METHRAKLKKLVVELDLSDLDESITIDQLRNICVEYYNLGEGMVWRECVPFKVIRVVEGEEKNE
jgi:hypothetical protein